LATRRLSRGERRPQFATGVGRGGAVQFSLEETSVASPINRRSFVKSTGLLAAGTALPTIVGRPSATHAGELTGRLRKAAGWEMVAGNLSCDDKLRLLKDVGFEGVEVPVQARDGSIDPKALARASEKVALPIHGVVNASQPNLRAAIDEATLYGATSVLYVVPSDPKASFWEQYRKTQETIRREIPYAEKKQVYILIENVWATFLIDPVIMARYLDELDSPFVRSYFDIGNVVRWGWPQQWIEVLGKRIVKLHAKEYDLNIAMNQGMAKAFDRPLGKGSIDWPLVRQALKAIDYHGWVTAEVRGGDRKRMTEIARQIDEVL
jgi:L-ribulose-5-phosphate 3-epimerase